MRRALLAVALLMLPTLLFAQGQTTGRITGTVVDEEKNPVSGVEVTISSDALQGDRTFTTDKAGRYLAPLLPAGVYTVSVVAPGKQTIGYTVRVGIGQTVPLDLTLRTGTTAEEVNVLGNTSKLETTAGGESFNYSSQIADLPIVNRAIERVAELAPNVSFGPTPNTLSISGAPSFDTRVLLDGAEVSDPYFGSAPDLYLEEAIEEVQVLTSGVEARYGRFQGGVINATTKSGGNTFDGSARVDLSKESWNQKTPFNENLPTDLNKVYSATFGGPIVKDHLQFFVAGRTIPTASTAGQTALSGQNFTSTREQDRWQVKLTGAVNPNHVIEASYLKFEQTLGSEDGLPAGDLRALAPRDDPREAQTLEYQGILTDRTFLNVQGTRKRVSILNGGDPALGSPFLDFYGAGFQIWHNHWWDGNDASVRDNDTLSTSLTHTLSSGSWGDHTLEYGVQYVKSSTAGENRQSVTGFNLLNYDAIVSGNEFTNINEGGFDPADPRFNLISLTDPVGGLTYRWVALPLGGDQKLENTALYVQDTWEFGKWRVDGGLRWEKYEGKGPQPTLDLDFDALSPRLGVTYNIDTNWQIQATWGKYVSRFNDNVASSISGVGGAPYVVSLYTGPTTCPETAPGSGVFTHCLTYADIETILQNNANFGVVTKVTDPTQPTRFLASDVAAPYATELNLAVKRALPRNSGTFTLTYTDRKYRNLLDDFIGDRGVTTVTDPIGGVSTFDLDTTIWDNASIARRDYDALAATWDYRPSVRWNLGGNWTYAHTRGNYEGEGRNTPASGSIIGNYLRSIPQEAAIPYGFTDDDIRHRVRAWGAYRFDFGRAGALTLGSIGTYQSGLPYNLTGAIALADDPAYLNEVGTTYTHFFGGRGNQRFNGFWALDLSTRYQFTFRKDLAAYVKLDILNVTNNDSLVLFRTSGSAARINGTPTADPALDQNGDGWIDGTGVLAFTPASTFGRARNKDDYQLPRRFFVSMGLQW